MITNEDLKMFEQIAKEHNPDIISVKFQNFAGKTLGTTYKHPDTYKYYIAIHSDIPCNRFALFVFYHELAHVLLYHIGYRCHTLTTKQKEEEADLWAFNKLKFFSQDRKVNNDYNKCMICLTERGSDCYASMLKNQGEIQEVMYTGFSWAFKKAIA